MLWQMRAEEEGLAPIDAQDAVLRENLFGLELDPRCVQIAMLPLRSGLEIRRGVAAAASSATSPVPESRSRRRSRSGTLWPAETSVSRRPRGFTSSSATLILSEPDRPRRVVNRGVRWATTDVRARGLGAACAVARRGRSSRRWRPDNRYARRLRSRYQSSGRYPFTRIYTGHYQRTLSKGGRSSVQLRKYCDDYYPDAKHDLAMAMLDRLRGFGATDCCVLPHGWLFMSSVSRLPGTWLGDVQWNLIAHLGTGAFGAISGAVVNVILASFSKMCLSKTR